VRARDDDELGGDGGAAAAARGGMGSGGWVDDDRVPPPAPYLKFAIVGLAAFVVLHYALPRARFLLAESTGWAVGITFPGKVATAAAIASLAYLADSVVAPDVVTAAAAGDDGAEL
jgi:hypothetical protein